VFFFGFEIVVFIGPLSIFWKHWALPNGNGNTFLDTQLQNKKKKYSLITHLFNLYTWELNLGKPYGIKLKCYPPPHQKKKTRLFTCTIHECMLSLPIGWMIFLFPKLINTIFCLGQYPFLKA
jgi:hypothetical protein